MLKTLLLDSKLFFFLLVISLLLIFLDHQKFLNLPISLAQQVTQPIQFGFYKIGQSVSRQFEFVTASRRASQENKALKEQMASILSENANLRTRLAEAEGFLEQQKVLSPKNYKMVGARPIGVSRFFRIDKGSTDQITVNQAVVYKDNLLGLIKNTSPNLSEVIMPTDPDSKIAVFSSNKDGKSKGVLVGQFGSEMLMDKILHQETIQPGDLVYTEGTEVNIPRGLIAGQVIEVLDRPNEVFKQAKVKPVFQIGDLDIVFVITN